MSASWPRILGVDPSITATGVAVADVPGSCFTVKTNIKDGDKRLLQLFEAICLEAQAADYAVIEDLPTHAKSAGKTGMAQGVVRAALCSHDVPYVIVTPATLKLYATGKGNADKAAMALALEWHTGLTLKDDNQVDAWWLRAIGFELAGDPLVDVPERQSKALEKVKLPNPKIYLDLPEGWKR